jgi:hypothetical protein
VRVQQPEQDEVVMAARALEESARVIEVDGNPGRVVRMLGMFAPAQLEDGRINFDCVHGCAAIAQGGGRVIAAARAHDHHGRMRGRKPERQVVRIVLNPLLQQARMAGQKIGRQVCHPLVAGMVDENASANGFVNSLEMETLVFDLLVWRPKAVVVGCGRLIQQQCRRQRRRCHKPAFSATKLQQPESDQHRGQPYRRRPHQPGRQEEAEDSRQAAQQVPGIGVQRIGGRIELPAYGLAQWNKHRRDEHHQKAADHCR